MRRLAVSLLGIGAVVAFLRRRGATGSNAAPEAAPADAHADELRRRLAEARAAATDRDEFEAGEVTVDNAEPSVDERRRDVHEGARDEIGRMRGDGD